jgi:hypothetical protein
VSRILVLSASQPAIVFAVLLSEPLFKIVLGETWVGAAPIFCWLGLAGLNQGATATTAWRFLSQERGQDSFRFGIWCALFNVLSFGMGLPWGALGVAISYTAVNYAVVVPLYAISVGHNGPVTTRNLIETTGPRLSIKMNDRRLADVQSLIERSYSLEYLAPERRACSGANVPPGSGWHRGVSESALL